MTQLTIHTQLQLGNEVLAEGDVEVIHTTIIRISSLLPENCRNSFYLTIVHGLSDREVAQFINTTTANVREHMDIALRYIRENVEFVKSEIGSQLKGSG